MFSSGIDGIPNTSDDIYPTITAADSTKFGLIRKQAQNLNIMAHKNRASKIMNTAFERAGIPGNGKILHSIK